MEKRRMERGIL